MQSRSGKTPADVQLSERLASLGIIEDTPWPYQNQRTNLGGIVGSNVVEKYRHFNVEM